MEKEELMRLIEQEENDEVLKSLIDGMVIETHGEMELPAESGEIILQSILEKERAPGIIPIARKINRLRWVSIAAASVIMAGMLTTYLVSYRFDEKKEVVSQTANLLTMQVNTGTAQRKTVQLPDGTQVWLSPSTLLEYPAAFEGDTREVTLSGEAFFEVAHDSIHPFLIRSDNIQTKVLGTSFNIQAYHNQKKIAVMVVTGRVKISNLGSVQNKMENIEISANQKAVFDKNTDRFIKEETDTIEAPNMLKRKEGEFVYKNEPLLKIAEDIEEYFGVKIKVADEIRNCEVVASFNVTDKPEDVLEVIAITVNGKLARKDQQYTIEGKICL
ncbi:MAG TPA: FecR domain-containing protein [Agriterribacter sp.]|nr:FecR domain-containing protein [Agriterribacter sp.]